MLVAIRVQHGYCAVAALQERRVDSADASSLTSRHHRQRIVLLDLTNAILPLADAGRDVSSDDDVAFAVAEQLVKHALDSIKNTPPGATQICTQPTMRSLFALRKKKRPARTIAKSFFLLFTTPKGVQFGKCNFRSKEWRSVETASNIIYSNIE